MKLLRAAVVTAVSLLALGLSACSDDDKEPTSAPTSDASSESTTASPSPEPSWTMSTTPTPEPTEPTESTQPVEPSEPVDPDAPPTTYDAAQARLDALGQVPQEAMRFETSTGIYCLLDSDFAIGCELPAGGVPDPDYCGNGPSQNVGRVTFGESGPLPECNSDTIREPGAPKIDLGTVARSSATGVTCLVEAVGVTCLDPARTQGFFLSTDDYTVFTAG